MNMENYRIQDKRNVQCDGKRTAFKVFERKGDAFIYSGNYFAFGWDCSDEECVKYYLAQCSELDDE